MDEENIVRRMINGDMDAFGELMEKYEGRRSGRPG